MKNIHSIFLLLFIGAFILINACGTSTGSRYSKSDTEKSPDSDQTYQISYSKDLKEDFDISQYKSIIELPEQKQASNNRIKEIWFEYGESSKESNRKILTGTSDGFRVLVTNTDNLEEANQIKAEVINKLDRNEIYVDFDPPFYKVKVGDFIDQKSADNIRFKLNQLGYKEAKVIKDKINIFK